MSVFFSLTNSSSCSGSPYSSSDSLLYDYMSDQPESGEREQAGAAIIAVPSFVSGAQELVVNAGDTVRLPCQVDRLQVREKQYI